ncbi:hypothetical protein NDU88_007006 [Pleurodeles waltl]|uniref:Uncharacterized protein n=1 Tax=Pleurodeles waltl TaxID=8319 RepID=A0AAV7NW48_PLEWA|nr:hypothetical protein NDU88_007006 [Pleurodeles waltl]
MAAVYVMARRMRILAGLRRGRRRQEHIFRVLITLFDQTQEEIYEKYRLDSTRLLDLIVDLQPICGSTRSPELEEEYPVGTPGGADAIPEEAGAYGRRDRNNDTETIGVLNPVREKEEEVFYAGARDEQRTESGTD